MRLLVASDLHGADRAPAELQLREREHRPDAIVLCGDITDRGKPRGFLKRLIGPLTAPVLAIPGNCDPTWVHPEIEEAGATLLHGRRLERGGETFVGFGGTGPHPFGGPFQVPEEEIAAQLRALLTEPGAIVVVHQPPRGVHDRVRWGFRVGSRPLAALVEWRPPKLLLSGHVHEARGVTRKGATLYVNPGPGKRGCAALVEVGPAGVEARLL
ncbi:MAG: metallophosphoesterase family protein [Planctomycetales bacterium]|nr:metallophosphoesterase family protein [Planctomycetales bacterium]